MIAKRIPEMHERSGKRRDVAAAYGLTVMETLLYCCKRCTTITTSPDSTCTVCGSSAGYAETQAWAGNNLSEIIRHNDRVARELHTI